MLVEFDYLAPVRRDELLVLLKKGKKMKILAGGTDLLVDIRAGKLPIDTLVDIKKIPEFRAISFSPKEGLSIGAAVTCSELIGDPMVQRKYPLLVNAASRIGSLQLRNRATIAGNLCTASPCSDMGCSLLACGASLEIISAGGNRTVKLKDFFTGVKKTALQEQEVVLRILVPVESADAEWGMEKLKRIKGHDLALASVAMIKTAKTLRIGVGSCAPTSVVLKDLPPGVSVKDACAEALKVIKPIDDLRASKEFRTFIVQVMISRLIDGMKRRK